MPVVLEELHGHALVITMNRPSVRNAIDTGQTAGLLDACARLDTEPAIGAGVRVVPATCFAPGWI
jgi:enoyl-CoA hydratase/carnithine racemase